MFQLVLYMFQFAGIVPRKREGKTTLYSTKHLDAAMKFIPKQLTDGLITLKDAVSKYNFLIPNHVQGSRFQKIITVAKIT